MNTIKAVVLAAVLLFPVTGIGPSFYRFAGVAYAQEDWKAEFDDICAKTDDSLSLSKDEVKSLIERCDALKPRIEKLEETARKVYLKRLQTCRDLFAFVLESKTRD